ncbi:hypothetical protein RHECNPAF_4310097 [Rhizobium etli CNPAF512]|nr:hypothetical protein RHECNPAF_4310097 [Rhizobium etli CNPAF512]
MERGKLRASASELSVYDEMLRVGTFRPNCGIWKSAAANQGRDKPDDIYGRYRTHAENLSPSDPFMTRKR